MNSQELRNLQEAYMEVVNNQLDEASGGIIGGGNFSSGSSSLKQKPKGSSKLGRKIGKHFSSASFGLGGEKPKDIADRTKSYSDTELNNVSRTSDEKEPGKGRSKSAREFQLKVIAREKRKRSKVNEEADLYDIILSHLLDEGYADTQEQAEAIMVNMSEEWRQSIVEDFPNVQNKPRPGDAGTSGLKMIQTPGGQRGYINKHSGGEILPSGTVNKIMGGNLMVKNKNPKSNIQTA